MCRRALWLLSTLVVTAALPVLAPGEVVRLRDGSSLRGRLVAIEGDTLEFRLAVGPRLKIHRSQVLTIVFDDSAAAVVTSGPGADAGMGARPSTSPGTGTVTVSFKDRSLSSKISIDKKKDWEAHVRSNHIVVRLILDGRPVYTVVDSTMDKTIHKGHVTQLRNDAVLEDFTLEVPAGTYLCELVVHSFDEDTFRDDFEPEPLRAALVVDALEVRAGAGSRILVGIDRGKLKLGRVKLYRVE